MSLLVTAVVVIQEVMARVGVLQEVSLDPSMM